MLLLSPVVAACRSILKCTASGRGPGSMGSRRTSNKDAESNRDKQTYGNANDGSQNPNAWQKSWKLFKVALSDTTLPDEYELSYHLSTFSNVSLPQVHGSAKDTVGHTGHSEAQ